MLSVAGGCGGGGVPASALATPKDTLETVRKAIVDSDYATFCECLTDDAVYELAGSLRMVSGMLKAVAQMGAGLGNEGSAAADFGEKLDALMKKHVPEDAPQPQLNLNADPESMRAAVRESGKAVKDPKAFVADFMELADSMQQQSEQSSTKDVSIGEIKIDGDTATTTITGFGVSGGGREESVKLRNVDGLWKIAEMGEFGVSPNQ